MKTTNIFAIAVMSVLAVSALASDLTIGSTPPALTVAKWYKGSPVTTFDNKKTYVVEFWATWCGPCKETIPHLTEMARKNEDITFIGVSIWEDDNGTKIADFVKQMGDKMDYHVGYSSNKGGMAKSWMAAAGQNGIPTAFIVKNGQIDWIGHPMMMEKPLAEIKADKFDVAAFKIQYVKAQTSALEEAEVNRSIDACSKQYQSGKKSQAKVALNAIVAKHPTVAPKADLIKLGWLAAEDAGAWETKAKAMAASSNEDMYMTLDMFAITQATDPSGNQDLGKKAIGILLAGPQSKNVLVLYDAATVYQSTKEYKKALDVTNTFLVEIKTSKFKDNADLIKSMEKQKAELEAKIKG